MARDTENFPRSAMLLVVMGSNPSQLHTKEGLGCRRKGCPTLTARRRMALRVNSGRGQDSGHINKYTAAVMIHRISLSWINISDYTLDMEKSNILRVNAIVDDILGSFHAMH